MTPPTNALKIMVTGSHLYKYMAHYVKYNIYHENRSKHTVLSSEKDRYVM